MAASIVRSSINPLPRHVIYKPSPSDHRSRTTITIHVPYPKRRCNVPVLASSIQSHNNNNINDDENANSNSQNVGGGGGNKIARALELQRILDDCHYDDVSKDPNNNMLPSNISRAFCLFLCSQIQFLFVSTVFLILRLILLGPLSSTQFSASVSDGSRLRVAYQVSFIYIYIYNCVA